MFKDNIIAQRYIIKNEISSSKQGGTCLVFDIFQENLQILKWTDKNEKSQQQDMANEFSILLSMSHPFIVQPLDFGYDKYNDIIYLTTEFISGHNLKTWWNLTKDFNKLFSVFIEIIQAIQYLNIRNIIHGDIKPENIIINNDSAKLIDFGFSSFSGIGDPRGTPEYLAPEIKSGNCPDIKSDLFSLGATFWNIITGKSWNEVVDKYKYLIDNYSGIQNDFTRIIVDLLEIDIDKRISCPSKILEFLHIKEASVQWNGVLPFVGRAEIINKLKNLINNSQNNIFVLSGVKGIGKSYLLNMLKWIAQINGNVSLLFDFKQESNAGSDDFEKISQKILTIIENYQEKYDSNPSSPNQNLMVLLLDNFEPESDNKRKIDFINRLSKDFNRLLIVISCKNSEQYKTVSNVIIEKLGPFKTDEIDKLLRITYNSYDFVTIKKMQELTGGIPYLVQKAIEFLSSNHYLPSKYIDSDIFDTDFFNEYLSDISTDELYLLYWLGIIEKPVDKKFILNLFTDISSDIIDKLTEKCLLSEEKNYYKLNSFIFWKFLILNSQSVLLNNKVKIEQNLLSSQDIMFDKILTNKKIPHDEIFKYEKIFLVEGNLEILKKFYWSLMHNDFIDKYQEVVFSMLNLYIKDGFLQDVNCLLKSNIKDYIDSNQKLYFNSYNLYIEGQIEKAKDVIKNLIEDETEINEFYLNCVDLYLKILLKKGLYLEAKTIGEKVINKINDSYLLPSIYFCLGRICYFEENYDQGIKYALIGIEKTKNNREKAVGYGLIGLLENTKGNIYESKNCYKNALKFIEQFNIYDVNLEGNYLLNLSLIYFQLGQFDKNINLLEKSLNISRRNKNVAIELNTISNLANTYCFLNKKDEFLHYIDEGKKIADKTNMEIYKSQLALIEAEFNIKRNNYPTARELLKNSKESFLKLNSKERYIETILVEAFIESLINNNAGVNRIVSNLNSSDIPKHLLARYYYLKSLNDSENEFEMLWESHRKVDDIDTLALIMVRLSKIYLARKDVILSNIVLNYGYGILLRCMNNSDHNKEFWMPEWRKYLKDKFESDNAISPQNINYSLKYILNLQKKLMEEEDSEHLLNYVMDAAVEITGAERGFLILRDEKKRLKIAIARNIDKESIKRAEFKISRTIAERTIEESLPVLSVNADEESMFLQSKSIHLMGLKSVLCIPIRGRQSVKGAIYLDNRFIKGAFTQKELELSITLGDLVALALENIELRMRLVKKAEELEELNKVISNELERKDYEVISLKEEVLKIKGSLNINEKFPYIIGRSRSIDNVLNLVEKVASSPLPVVIEGETGTGKELIARAVHETSTRKKYPFVTINCGALPETLIESELFGFVKGAFTGAVQNKIGLIRQSNGGTLFLDELETMSLNMQTKLLRVIERGEVKPVGSEENFNVDIRIIAATNIALKQLVENKTLREDLFYRLNVINIKLPALKERKEDIPLLVEYFLQKAANFSNKTKKRITPATLKFLIEYNWPGNIRQLENIILAASLNAESEVINPEDLPKEIISLPLLSRNQNYYKDSVKDLEKDMIIKTLKECGGNRIKAAKILGISRPTLYRKLNKFGI